MASSKRLSATIEIGGAIAGSFKSMIGSARGQIGGLGSSITQLNARQKELNNTIKSQERLGIAGSALRVQYAQQELGVITQQIEAIKRRNAVLAKGQERREIGSSMMMGGGLMIGAGLATAATLGKPIKEAGDFEHEVLKIGLTARMTNAEMGKLKEQIFEVSKASNKSVDAVTGGIGFLIAAGMEARTAAASIGIIAKASTASSASVEDLAKASFTLNDTLNIAPDKLNAALNILSKAGKAGNVELKDMAKQLPVLGSGFKALGMEGPEAAATIGAALQIARKGASDSDEAANNVKNLVAKLMSPETLKKAKKEFSLDLYGIIKDAQTKGKNPFEEAMKAIAKVTKGDQKAIGELFGDMQVQNAIRPLIDKWAEYEKIKRESMTTNDELADDFNKMMESMKSGTEGLGNAWQRLMITMGTTATPVIGSVSRGLQGVVEGMDDITKAHPTTVGGLMAVVGGVAALTTVLGVGRLAAGGFMYAWGAVPPILGVVRAAIGATMVAVRGLTAALASNPIGLALLAGGLVASNWDSITGFFKGGKGSPDNAMTTTYDDTELAMGGYGAPLPAPAMRGATGATTNNVTNAPVFNIAQQPGQDSKALADEIMRKMDERRGIQRRSIMFDPALGY